MFPLLPPPRRRLRGGGRRGNGAQTARGHLIFMKNLPGTALLPESARGLPHCGHCPQGTPASIGASYALMIRKRSSTRIYLARGTKRSTITPSPTRFGNGLKPAIAHARGNRTRARIIRLTPVTARSLGPRNRGTLQRSPHCQTLTIARLNRPDTWNCATLYDLDHPARDRLHEAQRPQASAATLLGSSAFAHKPHSDYWKRATPPPAQSRHRLCILSRTPTHQTLRPTLNGLTDRHARLLAERKILSRDTASAAPPDSRSLHTATVSRSRLLPICLNLNPRRRETRLTPVLPRQETSTTTVRSLSLLPKTSRITRSLQSST